MPDPHHPPHPPTDPDILRFLRGIDDRLNAMTHQVRTWAGMNSGSHHAAGVGRVASAVATEFAALGGRTELLPVRPEHEIDSGGRILVRPLGPAVSVVKRPAAARRVLLCIHLDTVFEPDHPFQNVTQPDADTLVGPGVADAKGGIAVMLAALRAFEESPLADRIGWEVLLNSDEEIGSPGSSHLLEAAAKRNQYALVYEPAWPDGSVVGSRMGSGTFVLVVRGKAAHAGRDFSSGRSAILAVADLIRQMDDLNHSLPGVIVNCGRVDGGGAVNIVPELSIGRFNVRTADPTTRDLLEREISRIVRTIADRDGITIEIHGGFQAPPLPMTQRRSALYEALQSCARSIDLFLPIVSSGGASDGNKLYGFGLQNVIDGLGPVGGALHSDREFLKISSLSQRAKLSFLLLARIASGDLDG